MRDGTVPPIPGATFVGDDMDNMQTKRQKKRMKERQRVKAKKAQAPESAAGSNGTYDALEEHGYNNSYDNGGGDQSSSASSFDGAEANVTSTSTAAAVPNPQEVLRSELMTTYGYLPVQIDEAMEQMFELGLPYDVADEVDAFLRLLQKRKEGDFGEKESAAKGAAAAESESRTWPSTPPDDSSPISRSNRREEVAEETKEEEPVIAGADDDDAGDSTAANDDITSNDAKVKQAAEPVARPADESKKSTTASNAAGGCGVGGVVGVLARLEMVSKATNLDDAIFALTEWVDKVATPTEIVELCDANKCRAFHTVLKRTIQSPNSSNDKKVLSLVSEVIRTVGGDQDRPTGSVTAAIDNSIKSARAVFQSSKAFGSSSVDGCADTVADRVAKDLHRAVAKLRRDNLAHSPANPTSKAETIRALEAEIEALAASLATIDGGLLGLMTKRDCHRSAADMSSTIVSLAVASSTPSEDDVDKNGSSAGDNSGDDSTAAATDANPKDVITSLLGNDYDAVISAKAEYEKLRSDLDAARSSTESNRTDLIKERDGYTAERGAVNNRMEELRKELEELEEKGADLDASADAIEGRLEELDHELDDEVKTIKVGLSVRSAAYKLEEAARGVADELESLRNALDDTIAPVTPRGKNSAPPSLTPYSPEKVSTKMGIYFVRIRNYFKAEADCIEFISNRANSLEKGLADLEREIDECAMLGMTTNVMLMTNSLRETQQNITEDRGVVVMLTSEAEKVQHLFMKRLGEYKAAKGGVETAPCQALTSLQVSVLSGIRDAMKRIGLKDNGLSEYITDVASTPTTTPSITKSLTKAFDNNNDKAKPFIDNVDNGGGDASPSKEDLLRATDEFFAAADKDAVTANDICISIQDRFGVTLDQQTRQIIKDHILKLVDEEDSDDAPAKDEAVENGDAVSTLTPSSHFSLHSYSSIRLAPQPPPPVSASKMPRLSWARNPAAVAGRPPRGKSLLEIQQEEMSAKKKTLAK